MTITKYSDPLPKLSGAALRAAQAADRHADAVHTQLSAASERLTAALSVPAEDVDALAIIEALGATSGFKVACEARATLAARHRIGIEGGDCRYWPICPDVFCLAQNAATVAAWGHAERLRRAGVPMDAVGADTVEYWRDAAARGC